MPFHYCIYRKTTTDDDDSLKRTFYIYIFFFFSNADTMSGPTKVVKTKLFIGNLDPATQPGMKLINDILFLIQELFI